jgi:7,8-dihydropterin-6-yl-methyl-4-(beta-D-ribofuranosyl)aminobenzene 5'-phosphate synthase
LVILAVIGAALVVVTARFRQNQRRAEEEWAGSATNAVDLEPVEQLTILPLVEARTAGEDLRGEAGVSYLIQANGTRILFDLGLNAARKSPSTLQHNAQVLGEDLDTVDAVVISHRHLDHVGGLRLQMAHSFALPTAKLETGSAPVYVPESLEHATADVRVVEGPQRIAPGVASIGPIPKALFFMGWTPEQALAVNVAGKGIVLIVGCGHQGVRRIVERTEALFDEPLYGLVGGLHFPITGSPVQRIGGSDRPLWEPVRKEDTQEAIDYLRGKGLAEVAVSAHDSCEWALGAFEQAWGPAFEVVTAGQPLKFSA